MNATTIAIIEADADYFAKNSFISTRTYQRVNSLLDGSEDKEIQLTVANWLECDAAWIEKIAPSIYRYHWFLLFLYPLIIIPMKIIPNKLRQRARELKKMGER